MNNMVDIFSQSYDIDLKIKDRAGEHGIFHLSKGPFKGWVKYRAITKIFFIKKKINNLLMVLSILVYLVSAM